jgi:hypothetical protein
VPLLAVALAFLAVATLFVVLLPVMLVQRYRAGTRRQPARRFLVSLNLVGLTLSALLFLTGAAITSLWVPHALTYSAAGFAAGGLAGIGSLLLTRWESSDRGLYFTPNRLFVLAVMLAVTGRLVYGMWRAWRASRAAYTGGEWLVTAGVAESMAAGGLALGYYLTYWAGVRRRLARHGRS